MNGAAIVLLRENIILKFVFMFLEGIYLAYIEIPNLPESFASIVIIDGRSGKDFEGFFEGMGIRLLKTLGCTEVYDAISYHPDIVVHHLGGRDILYAPGIPQEFLDKLKELGFTLLKGESHLEPRYPGDIPYNAARVGRYAFHNTRYTDSILRTELEKRGVDLVHVEQGYSKCSVSVVSEDALITSDSGICKAAAGCGISTLLIEPEPSILLPGLSYGFIGGCTGMIGRGKWAVSGRLDTLKSAPAIREFLGERGVEIVELSNGALKDIGSIIPVLSL